MFERRVDTLRFVVEHRAPGADGGPTLRVLEDATGRELLRYDAFARGAHWHLDPGGPDEITGLAREVDALEWTVAALRGGLSEPLRRVGVAPVTVPDATLGELESALRNGPVDLDAIDVARREASVGEKWKTYPPDVLPVWVADMDYAVADPIRHVLRRAVELSDLGYPMHPAPTDVPDIYAAWASRRYGWEVPTRGVELLADVMQGVYVGIQQFSEPGEGVIVQPPVYAPFFAAIEEMGRTRIDNPLRRTADGYALDLDHLASVAKDARILLLSHPQNPTGQVSSRAELEAIARIAHEHDLFVISDEIHADLVLPGAEHVPFASLGSDAAEHCLSLVSASKAFNIAGLRFALACFGTPAQRRRFNRLPRHVRGGINILGIEAARAAWLHAEPWLDAAIQKLADNRAEVVDFVARELPGVVYHPGASCYFAWLDCSALDLPDPYRFFLEHGKLALSNGKVFGPGGEGFVRLNFATSHAILHDAFERMSKALRAR